MAWRTKILRWPQVAAKPGIGAVQEEHGGSAGGHVRSRLGSQEGAPPSSVRRKRFRAGAQDRQQGSPDVQQGAGPAAPGSPQVPAQPAQPSERHIVLRQWGADVTVAVLPPVYHQHNTATAEPLQPLRSTALETMASTHALDHVPVATPFANGEHAGPPSGVSNHMEAPKPPDAAERQASTQLRKPLAGVDSWTLARARSHGAQQCLLHIGTPANASCSGQQLCA